MGVGYILLSIVDKLLCLLDDVLSLLGGENEEALRLKYEVFRSIGLT
jgi:hypothetical protein